MNNDIENLACLMMALEIPPAAVAGANATELAAMGKAIAEQAKQVEPLQARIAELEKEIEVLKKSVKQEAEFKNAHYEQRIAELEEELRSRIDLGKLLDRLGKRAGESDG